MSPSQPPSPAPSDAAGGAAGRAGLVAAFGAVAAALALVAFFSAVGSDHDPLTGLAVVVDLLVRAGAAPAAYLLGAFGLGRVFGPALLRARDPLALQLALGLALMLSLSHLLGWLGLFSGGAGPLVALAPTGIGLVAVARQAVRALRSGPIRPTVPWPAALTLPGAALMLVAACNPPGWLWDSEAGGFDALAYHLQLPREWLALGRLAPLEHNVYSFLPSYVEAAFAHLAAMSGAPAAPGPAGGAAGLLTGDGSLLLSAQLLHAGLGLCSAVLIARAALVLAGREELDRRGAKLGASLAAAAFLSVPWVIVVGSLAYNELAVTALFAGALLAAADDQLRPTVRGALTGLLVGVACGAKPTALFFAGIPAGLVLLGLAPARAWLPIVAGGTVAGLAALSPWLIRNGVAAGNPLFPHLTDLLGTAHWTADQAERYAAATSFDGSLAERLGLLVRPGPAGPGVTDHRGLLHAQWSIFFPVAAACAAGLVWWRRTRRVGVLLGAGMVGSLVAWMFATHLQSRFLLPLAVPGAVSIGLATAAVVGQIKGRAAASPAALAVSSLVVLWLAAASVLTFAGQRGGRPNQLLAAGPGARSGEIFRAPLAAATPAERREFFESAPPEAFVNLALPPGETVYLLGDSTPLYFTVPTLYHSTWDRSPLGEAMRRHPGDPGAWTRELRERGVRFVLFNPSEIERLHRSGAGGPGGSWYDPLVTTEAAAAWLSGEGRLVRRWSERGPFLFELAPTSRETPSPP